MAVLRLSYAELGERLNRSADATRVLARRRRWQRVTGNDGRAIVLIDEADIQKARSADRPPERPPEQVDMFASLRAELEQERRQSAALQKEVAELRIGLGRAEERIAARDQRVSDLADHLALEQRRAGDLLAQLQEARRPWLVRVVAALRR
jgi:predicted  nucleic acid-binding Zn-ribbon protein